MTTHIDMGAEPGGVRAGMDLEELLASRLLVQGNSGSGKSHLLRRLLEQSAGLVQQVVIDPEGDFVSLASAFGQLVIEAADYTEAETANIAARVRQHRLSVILNLEGLEMEGQMRCAAAFLAGLFDAPREHWFPALVVVDEAQIFAPAAGAENATVLSGAAVAAGAAAAIADVAADAAGMAAAPPICAITSRRSAANFSPSW